MIRPFKVILSANDSTLFTHLVWHFVQLLIVSEIMGADVEF